MYRVALHAYSLLRGLKKSWVMGLFVQQFTLGRIGIESIVVYIVKRQRPNLCGV